MRRIAAALAALLLLLLVGAALFPAPPDAGAHSVGLVVKAGGMDLTVTFGGGFPAGNADVKVYREDGTLCLQGRADSEGRFRFEPKEWGKKWVIVAEHSGHTGQSVFSGAGEKSGMGLPLPLTIGAGLGYLVGLAGIALGYRGLKAGRGPRGAGAAPAEGPEGSAQ